jgi:DNA helicase-2/ATP-dependent DNA helicase PcrA
MVDEYQDTNNAQFRIIEQLASHTYEDGHTEHNLCVVGDDDQSIYKFRGADITNILSFENKYKNTRVITLDQNYRSTGNILEVANTVIRNNEGRKAKKLWTAEGAGENVCFIQYNYDADEARGIVEDIIEKINFDLSGNTTYRDFAILYRTNAQSRSLEEKLVAKNVPYRIVGGVNFYQRKEIKDILAYLKTIDNGQDALQTKRIINIPKRGIWYYYHRARSIIC